MKRMPSQPVLDREEPCPRGAHKPLKLVRPGECLRATLKSPHKLSLVNRRGQCMGGKRTMAISNHGHSRSWNLQHLHGEAGMRDCLEPRRRSKVVLQGSSFPGGIAEKCSINDLEKTKLLLRKLKKS